MSAFAGMTLSRGPFCQKVLSRAIGGSGTWGGPVDDGTDFSMYGRMYFELEDSAYSG